MTTLCRATLLQVVSSLVSASSAAAGVPLSLASLNAKEASIKFPKSYYGLMAPSFLIELYRFWHDEGATAVHNLVPPGSVESPLLVGNLSAGRSSPGRRSLDFSASKKQQAAYFLCCAALGGLDLWNQLFVYVSAITWGYNYNNSDFKTHQHYISFDYTQDLSIFASYYALTWPFVFYGEISPTAREISGYNPEGRKSYFEMLPAPLQELVYKLSMALHVVAELLPLPLLIPPESIASIINKLWAQIFVLGLGGLLILCLFLLKLAITHYCEGDKFREEVTNSKLAKPKPSALVRSSVKNFGALMCFSSFADAALPLDGFAYKEFLQNQPVGVLFLASGLASFVVIAVYYGVYKQVCKEIDRSHESSPEGSTTPAEDATPAGDATPHDALEDPDSAPTQFCCC